MPISTTESGDGKIIVKVFGPLNDMVSAMEFGEAIADITKRGHKHIVLDLNGVDDLNGYGIGKIILTLKKVGDTGGTLYYVPVRGAVNDVIDELYLKDHMVEYKIT